MTRADTNHRVLRTAPISTTTGVESIAARRDIGWWMSVAFSVVWAAAGPSRGVVCLYLSSRRSGVRLCRAAVVTWILVCTGRLRSGRVTHALALAASPTLLLSVGSARSRGPRGGRGEMRLGTWRSIVLSPPAPRPGGTFRRRFINPPVRPSFMPSCLSFRHRLHAF